jgi:hypothetical protein
VADQLNIDEEPSWGVAALGPLLVLWLGGAADPSDVKPVASAST